jgi:hypothetical protein
MFRRKRRIEVDTGTVALAVGAAVGTAAAVYLAVRRLRARRARARDQVPPELNALEESTVQALREDDVMGRRPIDVAALGPGIIELTGNVQNAEEARHAVEIAQRVAGVHTVINRLTLGDLEEHLAETRARLRAGDPALHETQWYGMSVGMGRRRQAPATDPEQRDDRNRMVSRALEPDATEDFPEQVDRAVVSDVVSEETDRRAARGRPEPE